jgi:arginyl-tRNA synthetase
MPTIAAQLDRVFRDAIRAAFDLDADPLIGVAQNEKFGDYQSNAAMGLAKVLAERTGQKANPRAIAERIRAQTPSDSFFDTTIAGPGFINIQLRPDWLAAQLAAAGNDPSGRLDISKNAAPQTVVVDYSGPNIAKTMHVGHLRSTIIGDAIARTLDFSGHRVIRQNHLGDWGTQFGRVVLAMWYEAVFSRTEQHAALDALVDRQVAAARQLAEDKNKVAYATTLAGLIRELLPLHQRFIDADPDGSRYFLPYLRENSLSLDELERAYVFVSAVTDAPAAADVVIRHPQHGPRTLAELPRLTTTFIQNPDLPDNEQEKLAWERARAVTVEACNQIYRRLNVQLADPSVQTEPMDRGESFYNPFLATVVRELKEKGLAKESEGATVVEVPGYESPLIIQKSDGSYNYGTTDLAAIRFRTEKLGAKRIVYFVDARQSQHFQQVFWTAKQAGWAGEAELEHAGFGTMLGADGKPFKTRSGDTPKLKDLLDEAEERAAAIITEKNPELPESLRATIAHAVGVGAVKYADLSKDRTSDYVFAWERMLSFDGNTAPYLQNAHVRVHGIFRKARSTGIPISIDYAKIKLEAPHELSLAKHLLRLGEALEVVARELKPHHLSTYLYDLANRFHAFFEHCPVLQSEEPTRSSRLALVDLTGRTLALGMGLLGIEHPEQM